MEKNNGDNLLLRYIDVFPVETEHGRMVALRDPAGVSEEMLVVSPEVLFVLQFLDGRHSTADVRDEYRKAVGRDLPQEQLDEIIFHLDKNYFLHNTTFIEHKRKIEADFLALPVRPSVHAGQSYESEPLELAAQIDAFFKAPGGAGEPGLSNGAKLRGLIAPHIDIKAGGPCYSHAYRRLLETEDIDCFVILGTGHYGVERCYATIDKDFETPFGTATCDRAFQELLKKNCNGRSFVDVMPHREEHSIEFQLIFLQHLLRRRSSFTFVPILCSFSYQLFEYEHFSEDRKLVEDFSGALRQTIEQYDGRVCFIASVDFSHVGPRYGDDVTPDDSFLQQVSAVDHKLIKSLENVDSNAFHGAIRNVDDRYRVCGYSSLMTMLKSIQAKKGELLDYANTCVDEQSSTVTFASMALY